jgi:thioredoxin-like negative regulator of GroEL
MNVEVLKFSATWCGPCRVLAHTLEGVEGITNIDVEKDMETARKYSIRSVPTLVFLKDGNEIARISGAISKKKYEEILTEINDERS